MSFDYWASHTFVHEYENAQLQAINYLLNGTGPLPRGSAALANVTDLSARLVLLAQAVATPLKSVARVGTPRERGGVLSLFAGSRVSEHLAGRKAELAALGLLPELPDLGLFPAGSFTIHFTFTLKTPYTSKDDTAFHLFDNPVRKEWVFKLPYIAPSQWKGALRAALRQTQNWSNDHTDLLRLFGTANEEEKTGESGCLYFYPSFFDRLGLEVINPHDRATGAGTLPIYYEVVPAGASATFTLLYVPQTPSQASQDLDLILNQGLKQMFETYGFGAKTSSGFGIAEIGKGNLTFNRPDPTIQPPPRPAEPQEPTRPADLQAHLANFPNEDFALKPDEWRKQRNATNSQREIYKNARAAKQKYDEQQNHYQQALAKYEQEIVNWENANQLASPTITQRSFANPAELKEQINAIVNGRA